MRVNTNILEAQGARLIKQFQTKLLTRGVSFHKRSRFPSSEVFNPSPHNLKREQRHSEQTYFTCVMGKVCGRSREGTMDLALGAFLRTYWDLLALHWLATRWGGSPVQQRDNGLREKRAGGSITAS